MEPLTPKWPITKGTLCLSFIQIHDTMDFEILWTDRYRAVTPSDHNKSQTSQLVCVKNYDSTTSYDGKTYNSWKKTSTYFVYLILQKNIHEQKLHPAIKNIIL